MLTASQIRRSFLEFFRQRGHEVVASGPLVPPNDPTLYFANAGMVQFKDVFTGKESRPYRRAATAQKCIRVSGKHNDLENVGETARHHTFFEMLGNFSFGDYFKQDAIAFAWEFLTGVLGLPAERMVVTVFGGEGDIPADEEAEAIWRQVSTLPDARILRCGAKENFWQMGETGPCGPCSEIHYYCGEGEPDVSLFGQEPGPDGRGWMELWNLVFMQFERFQGGRMQNLPAPSIDTGAGLERLSAVCQGVLSNYDSDLLRPIVELAGSIAGKKYGGSAEPDDVSMRVIADHARMTAFLIAEGVFPDRAERPYVLRRVMRRAVRHAHRLGIQRVCLPECALEVVELMGEAYPELRERKALIEQIASQEEERFRATLRRGLERLGGFDWGGADSGARVLPGPVAFELYDTYGFPVDLQQVIGREQGFRVDAEGFESEMARARQRSVGSKVGEQAVGAVYLELAGEVETEFLGYEREKAGAKIVALLRDGRRVEQLQEGESGEVLVTQTPFYAESGGQVGDRGSIRSETSRFEVEDAVKPHGELMVHRGRVASGALRQGDAVELEVDHRLRSATRRNHSATHLLHRALRMVVGEHAMQKGSLVGPDRLRFDYSAASPLTGEQIATIERMVTDFILANEPVQTEVLAMAEAKHKGAIGLFEEKYGEVVRMVRMGESRELCGGTHVERTGDIGGFKILSESGIAAGVRRIEAATGFNALSYAQELEKELRDTALLFKAGLFQTREKAERLLAQHKEAFKEIERLNQQLLSDGSRDLAADARKMGEVNVLGARVQATGLIAMREMADRMRDRLAPAVVLLGASTADGKAMLVCTVSKELTNKFPAGKLVKQAASLVGGAGGGRADFAQAGGPDGSRLEEALSSIYAMVEAGEK
jgi:alanyl-tRNA synthetase